MMFDYNSQKWKRKRLQILKRDGYMCQHCKRYGKAVPATTVHHIQHADEYPEMAFADKNLISLCEGCHNKQHPEKAAAARGRY
jgi:5-methylcytosine-specific restriction endonuclease McrA|nr:MAG TPA: NinG recombination protein [Caudoviricetes sp.]DAP05750.1 MAG TPA: NinG recombination protein [Bacteriophage sp.]